MQAAAEENPLPKVRAEIERDFALGEEAKHCVVQKGRRALRPTTRDLP